MQREQIIEIYDRHYNPTLALLFDIGGSPVEDHACDTHVHDSEGKAYLDFAAGYGVFSVGHRNRRVAAAVREQAAKLTSLPFLSYSRPYAELVTRLRSILPPELRHVLLSGSGSEAIETALRLARVRHPDRRRLVAAKEGFHGKTVGAVGVCGQHYLREPFGRIWSDVVFVPYGDRDALEAAVDDSTAAVLLEPVLGGGFVTVPPPGYIRHARDLCRRRDAVFVLDEVQTGYGRTGTMFAFEFEEVVPDVLILTKGMTGGHVSMAAAVVTEELMSASAAQYECDPLALRSSSAAWPLACAAATAAIEFTIDEDLPGRAKEQGPYLQQRLKEAHEAYPALVLGVPGRGLMTGVKLRNNMLENAVWLQMLKRGVITGLSTNPMTPTPVMRFFPPLIVSRDEIDTAADALLDALAELDRMPGLALDLANQVAKIQYHVPKRLLRTLAAVLS